MSVYILKMVNKLKMKKLNLGCGKRLLRGYINVDNNPVTNPDVVCDLEKIPYPFKENTFKRIILIHVLEHLSNPLLVIQELYRIAADDCIIEIKSPHFSGNFLHPGHKSFISTLLFEKFNPKNEDDHYGNCKFKVLSMKLFWLRRPKYWPIPLRIINKIINFFANLHVGIAQRVWCWYVGGFEEIYFKVKAIKPGSGKNR